MCILFSLVFTLRHSLTVVYMLMFNDFFLHLFYIVPVKLLVLLFSNCLIFLYLHILVANNNLLPRNLFWYGLAQFIWWPDNSPSCFSPRVGRYWHGGGGGYHGCSMPTCSIPFNLGLIRFSQVQPGPKRFPHLLFLASSVPKLVSYIFGWNISSQCNIFFALP
jgi:hypothetical protein